MFVSQRTKVGVGAGRRPRRTLLALAASVATLLLALGACNTPFIPLPPPDDPTFTQVMAPDGTTRAQIAWETRGGPGATASSSRIFIWNLNLHVGVIAQAGPDGSYVASPLDGQVGDQVELRYETPKGERSQVKCRILGPGIATMQCPQ